MIFVIRVPNITATHCMLYRHALAAKSLQKKTGKCLLKQGWKQWHRNVFLNREGSENIKSPKAC